MNRHVYQWFLTLGLLSALASTQVHAASDLNLVGLAMHRETGRDIYLAALHSAQPLGSTADIDNAPGAREMEFRIVARRTSIRSVLGSILLQAEVASGSQPAPATVAFANDIMASVEGSLYAGDSFAVLDNGQGETVAMVDGLEMARSDQPGVFNYFLSGWVGDRGATTAFRESLLGDDLNVDLRASYGALAPDESRLAEVGSWIAPEPEPAPEPTPAPEPAKPQQVASAAPATAAEPAPAEPEAAPSPSEEETPTAAPDTAPAATQVAAADTQATGQTATAPEAPSAATTPSIAVARVKPAVKEEASPASALAEETQPEEPSGAAALSVIEYSQRLASFNSMVFRMVNTKIRYPRAAIRRNIQGELELDLTVNRDGALVKVAVARSSGHSMLNESAVTAARRAFDDALNESLDEVAVAEYSGVNGHLVIPVPVNFVLTD